MRLATGLLILASIGALSQALATEPDSSGKPPAAAAKPAVTRELIKQAHDLGYKVEHRGDEVFFCRSEAQLGSRFEKKVCATPEQLDLIARQSQELMRKMQNSNMGPIPVKPGTQ